MSDAFVGEIRMFGGSFAPRGHALCDGQLLAISQNNALFSLLGTIYGGDGRTTFGLPDLRGRVPLHQGAGQALSQRNLGSKAGSERTGLSAAQLPAHGHELMASTNDADDSNPLTHTTATATATAIYGGTGTPVDLHADGITDHVGGGQQHDNVMPYQCINFIIALVGVFPSRD